MTKINTVLFDFDGTVMDTNEVVYKSWQHTYNKLIGKDGDEETIYKTFGEPLVLSMEKAFPKVPVEESIQIYRDYHYKNFEELISLFPGMKELLKENKIRKYKTALVTSRLKKTTIKGLEKYQIKDLFDCIVTMEDCTKYKPDSEPINIALNKLKSRPQESIMIGDTMYDILCAKNAGVKSVLVSWAEALDANKIPKVDCPDYIIDKANELLKII